MRGRGLKKVAQNLTAANPARVDRHVHQAVQKVAEIRLKIRSRLLYGRSAPCLTVRTLRADRLKEQALVAQELTKYKIDIAALSKTRLVDEASITEDLGCYTFFWKRYPQNESRIEGVGFAIRNGLLRPLSDDPFGISPRPMKLKTKLSNYRYATLPSCYDPTLTAL